LKRRAMYAVTPLIVPLVCVWILLITTGSVRYSAPQSCLVFAELDLLWPPALLSGGTYALLTAAACATFAWVRGRRLRVLLVLLLSAISGSLGIVAGVVAGGQPEWGPSSARQILWVLAAGYLYGAALLCSLAGRGLSPDR